MFRALYITFALNIQMINTLFSENKITDKSYWRKGWVECGKWCKNNNAYGRSYVEWNRHTCSTVKKIVGVLCLLVIHPEIGEQLICYNCTTHIDCTQQIFVLLKSRFAEFSKIRLQWNLEHNRIIRLLKTFAM